MNEMPGLWMAVHGRVFAHWRDNDAIFQLDFAETNGAEQGRHFFLLNHPFWRLFCFAGAEKRRADANFRGAFFDSDFKIVRHSHGKNRQIATQLRFQAVS